MALAGPTIQVLRPLRLHKRMQIVIPEVGKDILSNGVARMQPSLEWRRKGAFLRKPQCSIESHPAHQTGVQEFSRAATNLPYAFIGPLPVLAQPLQHALNILPPGIGN